MPASIAVDIVQRKNKLNHVEIRLVVLSIFDLFSRANESFHGDFMDVTNPTSPFLFAFEPVRTLWDYAAGQAWPATPLPSGDGHPVLVFPGFGASGAATADLRMRLHQLNYQAYDWECGVNIGPHYGFDQWLSLLGEQLQQIHAAHGRPVSVIGWSLGGIYARALGKRYPALVRQVITLATPFDSIHDTDEAHRFAQDGALPDVSEIERLAENLPVPSASIYSLTDGIVAWQTCVHPDSSGHRNIEVTGVSHFGMVYHPEVLRVVATLLNDTY